MKNETKVKVLADAGFHMYGNGCFNVSPKDFAILLDMLDSPRTARKKVNDHFEKICLKGVN